MTEYAPTERDYSLGFYIEYPTLREAVEIPRGFFSAGTEQRQAWAAIEELRKAGNPIQPITIAALCNGNGIASYLSAITSGLIPIKPGDYLRRILTQAAEDARKRQKSLTAAENPDWEEVDRAIAEAKRLEAEAEGARQTNPLISFPELRTLDVRVEWTIGGLLPKGSVTNLYGRTGIGKTWIALQIAEAVSAGLPIFGLATIQRPVVYIDMENPVAVMKERADLLGMRSMAASIWPGTAARRPPKLDGKDWELYKTIVPPGALMIVDTARASHDMDENESTAAALVMGRLQELRSLGIDSLVLSHTPKANDRDLKASGAWADEADHTLNLYKVKGQKREEDEGGEIVPGSLLCLSAGKKTRFAPMPPLYLTLGTEGLALADSPDDDAMDALAEYISGPGCGKNQTAIREWAKEAGVGPRMRAAFIALLNRGEGLRWRCHDGIGRQRIYEPIG